MAILYSLFYLFIYFYFILFIFSFIFISQDVEYMYILYFKNTFRWL